MGEKDRAPQGHDVLPRQPHGQGSVDVDRAHDVSVHLAHQHHAGDVQGLGVGDPQPVTELGDLAQAGHELADLGTTTVDHDGAHAHRPHEDDVLGEQRQSRRVLDGVAAVLDDDDLAPEAADVGQGLGQHRSLGPRV